MSRLRRRSGGPALAVVLVLIVAVACGGDPAPSATPTAALPSATTTAAPPTASPSATPAGSPGAVDEARLAEIEAQVIALRGLEPKAPVERAVLDEAGLREFITTSFAEDNPEALVQATETLYKALLLMPEGDSLEDLYIELLTSQVAGFYDDKTKKMHIVSRTGELGPADEITYAHEYTHALQDQAFGLSDLIGEDKDQGDRSLARLTLAEGDATLLMSLWAQQHLTPAELGEAIAAADPASQAVLDRMPAFLKEPLLFPYTSGLTLAIGDFTSGGYAAVDARYDDPPSTTEQILHPDKLAAGEEPVPVTFPDDLAARLGDGWAVSLQDTFGEFGLELLLRDAGGVTSSASQDAAAGWGGDRVGLVEGPDGATGVVIDTAWDTEEDAREYAAAIGSVAAALTTAGRPAQVLTPAPGRVVLVTAESDGTLGRLANVLGLAG